MEAQLEEQEMTPEESQQAHKHWDSLMFAPSRVELEMARQELGQASLSIQLAVIGHISKLWLQNYTPRRNENPFLAPSSPLQVQTEELEITPEPQRKLLWPEQPSVEDSWLSAITRLCTMKLSLPTWDSSAHPHSSFQRLIH